MSVLGLLREIAIVLEEVKRLDKTIGSVRSNLSEIDERVRRLEDKARITDVMARSSDEQVRTRSEAVVAVGMARLEGDVKAKLVEFHHRLEMLELRGRQAPEPPLLPSP